ERARAGKDVARDLHRVPRDLRRRVRRRGLLRPGLGMGRADRQRHHVRRRARAPGGGKKETL
ncbi:MAG: hypothetical protein AVDCRST_MAG30-3415, partial [uncultured Solirubrobacteraceae bacterium]